METLMITTICIILFWHRFLKKKGGAVSNPPKHLCASKKRHLFLRHLVRHHLAGPISQKVILLQEQVHKDLSCKGAPWNCALCYTESFKESPTKSSTEWKGSKSYLRCNVFYKAQESKKHCPSKTSVFCQILPISALNYILTQTNY